MPNRANVSSLDHLRVQHEALFKKLSSEKLGNRHAKYELHSMSMIDSPNEGHIGTIGTSAMNPPNFPRSEQIMKRE